MTDTATTDTATTDTTQPTKIYHPVATQPVVADHTDYWAQKRQEVFERISKNKPLTDYVRPPDADLKEARRQLAESLRAAEEWRKVIARLDRLA